jgi:tRNA A37 threonylcarbamoyladenosine modification protein TsaB
VAVETFQAVIHRLPAEPKSAWVIDDALRGDVFAQKFVSTPAGWTSIDSPRLVSLHDWLAETTPGEIVSGPVAARYASEFSDKRLTIAPAELHRPTAFAIAKVGLRLSLEGKYADPFALNPLYIRRSAAEEKADVGATSS